MTEPMLDPSVQASSGSWLIPNSWGSAVYSGGALLVVGVTALKTLDLFKTWSLEEQARQSCYEMQSGVVAVAMLGGSVAALAVVAEVAAHGLALVTAAYALGAVAVVVGTVVALGCLVNRFLIPNNYGALGEQNQKLWGF